MHSKAWRVAPLIFASGFCALIYQMVWLREFRLFFGASTAATAAVLGIFMGGLGMGSVILGARSDCKEHPLRFYARLELMIALSAVVSPLLLWLMRHIYLALGGSLHLGLGLGTVIRLLMATFVLGIPTFLMGGTLPAVARAVVEPEDTTRRPVALLYGINTLGAVTGTAAATFYFFEAWGNHLTLFLAGAFNAWVSLAAFQIARDFPALGPSSPNAGNEYPPEAPPIYTYTAAAVAGFSFLLMELVWYRMLCALLGASAFTFGLILAVALLGIGAGGVIYALWLGQRRITLIGFAFVCALEAVCMALPYALGDRIALLAMLLRPLGVFGFYGFVAGWAIVAVIVVLPAAILSGLQFPMLIALLGRGKAAVGSHTGRAYAFNTLGAIAGSLAGGFGFLPLFSAPGVWKMVVMLLGALALTSVLISLGRAPRKLFQLIAAAGVAAFALYLLRATGPTAFWRHSEIGVGRLPKFSGTRNDFRDVMNTFRRDLVWEKDGVESGVGISKKANLNFIVNGKCDGGIKTDACTQIMSGLIGAILHPQAKAVLVVGLGTGSTAGWLAAVPSVEHVDVFELEPSILRFAEQCAPMNHAALSNPKLQVSLGDARELLLTTRTHYDLIVSEPSNPYRAGIASLFTREYYAAAASRLNPGGIFAQWLQAYEIDDPTVQTVYATFGAIFSDVETWQTEGGDLLLVGSLRPRRYDADELRRRIQTEPFRTALRQTWRVTDLEGFLAHHIAGNSFCASVQRLPHVSRNTDDKTVLEYAFARNVDLRNGFSISRLRTIAALMQTNKAAISQGDVNWADVKLDRASMLLGLGESPKPEEFPAALQTTATAYASFMKNDLIGAWQSWSALRREPHDLNELLMVAECAANQGVPEAEGYIDKLRADLPNEADAILFHLRWQQGRLGEAGELLTGVLERLHTDPWLNAGVMDRTLTIAQRLIEQLQDESSLVPIYNALLSPFSVYASDTARFVTAIVAGSKLDHEHYGPFTRAALEPQEPFVPWQLKYLTLRQECYRAVNSPLAGLAVSDLNVFLANEGSRLGVVPPSGSAGLSKPESAATAP